ncbi:WG repeat-containing protein [Chitinophaga sancti]|uniref:WG containing repeat-containing protein n=1 Tax=Chitinophaga sancti TaxID=1004 RepID=A0A1K1RPE7_9BACT|nr:WG repeat-containing protein [Chitinophaga sancti]WQD62581.1 WG repeat-containing protein [Chitinophaga sancti]WQG91850.1 WG repeat-containing protein [Chitinophaga sancti]SFW73770.1 WG containing repeat-containing protein [Chitinophaga sancti]
MKYRLLAGCLLLLSGSISAQQKFEQGSRYVQGFARVVNHGQSFYIDSTGKIAFDTIYNNRSLDDSWEESEAGYLPQDILQVGLNGKQGVMTVQGKWVLRPEYDTIDTQSPQQWVVKKDNKVSLYTSKGFILPFRFEDSNQLDSLTFAVKDKGKWGVYNKEKDELIIPNTYEDIDYCYGCNAKGDYILAQKNGKWGVVSFKNEVLIPFEYDHEHMNMRSDEWVESFYKDDQKLSINLKTKKVEVDTCQCLPGDEQSGLDTEMGSFTGQRENGKWGLVNKDGKLILDHVYDDITYHANSALIGIVRNEKYGMADTTGKIVIPMVFDYWVEPLCGGALFTSEKNGKELIYDKTGKQILVQYSHFQEMAMEDGTKMLAIIQGKLYGFYNPATGKIVIPQYTSLSYYGDPNYLNIGVGDKYGYIDKEGNTVVPPIYDYVDLHAIPKNDQLAKINLKGKTGLFDVKQQKVLLPVIYDYISTYDDSTVLLVTKNGLSGICDFSGKMLAPVKYRDVVPFDSMYSLLKAKDSSNAEILNKRTHEIYKLPFDTAFVAAEGRLIMVWQHGKCFLYDIDKKQKVEGAYSKDGFPEYMGYFSNHRAIVVRNQKFGYIDEKGNYVVQPKYDYISNFHKGVAAVYECIDTAARIYRYGYIDSTGKEIVPVIYDVPQDIITKFTEEAFFGEDDSEVLVLMKNDGKKGLAGLNGRIIVPLNFDHISPEKHGRGYLVTVGDKFGILDMNGREIVKPIYERMMLDELEGYDGKVSFDFPVMMKAQDDNWTYIDERGEPIGVNVVDYVDFSTLDWGEPPVVDPPAAPAPPADEK